MSTLVCGPQRQDNEPCAVAGSMTRCDGGPRRPLACPRREWIAAYREALRRAFEAPVPDVPDVPDVPVKVPPLPRPKRKPPRYRCDRCGVIEDDPDVLCEPVPVS